MSSSLKLIQSITLSSTSTAVTFSNITQQYDDLIFFQNSRLVGDSHFYKIWFNGDGSSTPPAVTSYQSVFLWSWDTGVYCYFNVNSDNIFSLGNTYGSYSANAYNFGKTYISNYSSTSLKKSILVDSGEVNADAGPPIAISGGHWDATAAITSLTISPNGQTYAAGSTFRLYGVKG